MLENLQFIECLYLPDYINVVFEYCNVKYISYTANGSLKQNILRLSFPSRDCMLIFFVAKIFPVSLANISRLKNIWRGIRVRVIVNFCEQQQQSMLSVISDSAKVTTVSINEILDRLLTWGM